MKSLAHSAMPNAKGPICGTSTHFIAARLLSIIQVGKQHLMSTSHKVQTSQRQSNPWGHARSVVLLTMPKCGLPMATK